ncbi:MAG: hypothetical protein BRC29_00590 [Nanohaloarchaea archaeon SW_7_43_1]|nr:MAG: hypothetical protein BRC29_00590 [Nanohaloarchaea archaeon SW_7_43_1]
MTGEEDSRIDDLEEKVENIDDRLSRIEDALTGDKEDIGGSLENNFDSSSDSSEERDDSSEDSGMKSPSLESEVGLKWLGRIGVLAFVLGIAFSIRYAIQQDLIGYTTRIVLGLIAGLGISGLGWFAKEKFSGYERWGRTLMGGGTGIVYFVVYASYHFSGYQQAIGLTLEQNVFFLAAVALGMFAIAVRENSKVFGAEAVTAGFATAYLGTNIGYYILIYVGLLAGGTALLSYYKNWLAIHLYAFISTMGIYRIWSEIGGHESGLIFLTSMLALFTASSSAILHKLRELNDLDRVLGLASIYVTPLLFTALATLEFMESGIEYLYGIYFGIFALQTLVYFVSQNLDVDLENHYLFSGIPFGLTGIFLYFSDFWTTVVYSALAILLVFLSLNLGRKEISYGGYFVSAVAGSKVLIYDSWRLAGLSYSNPLSSTRLFAYLAVITGFTVIYLLSRLNRDGLRKMNLDYNLVERAFSWSIVLLSMTAIGLEIEGFRLSVLWGVYGLCLLIMGIKLRLTYFRRQSIAVLGITTFKVFIVDTSGLDTFSRTVSFLVLGILLIASSYIYTNYSNRIEEAVG